MTDAQQGTKVQYAKYNLNQITDKTNELSNGQFFLSPLEAILINKKMPFGIKLESEENVLKSIDMSKQIVKKNKIIVSRFNNLNSLIRTNIVTMKIQS